MASASSVTSQDIAHSYAFTWNKESEKISGWDQTDFQDYCLSSGYSFDKNTFTLIYNNSQAKTYRVLITGQASPLIPENNAVIYIFFTDVKDCKIRIEQRISQYFRIMTLLGKSNKVLEIKQPITPYMKPILTIDEVWSVISGNKPLVVFDLDETLVTNTVYLEDGELHSTPSPIEKDIGDQLQEAKQKYPHADFILITNSSAKSVPIKLSNSEIDPETFCGNYPLDESDSYDKTIRLLQHLKSKNNQYDQVIIIDDNQEVIKELATFCMQRKLPVNAFHYVGSVPQKHKQFRIDCVHSDQNNYKESDSMERLYKHYPSLKKERETYDSLVDDFSEGDISTTNC